MQKLSLFYLAFTSCILTPSKTRTPQQLSEYDKLKVRYTLAFEHDQVINLEELYQLEKLTRKKLTNGNFTDDQRSSLKRNHHKLKSLLVFIAVTKPLDSDGVLGKNMLATFVNHLRTVDPESIDLNYSNDQLFKLSQKDQMPLLREDRQFFVKFIDKTIAMTEEGIKKYHKNFPFASDNWRDLCPASYRLRCREFDLIDYHIKESYTLHSLTADVNNTIAKLNKIVTELTHIDKVEGDWWIFEKVITPIDDFYFKMTGKRIPDKLGIYRKTDFTDEKVIELYQEYDIILAEALMKNTLPIFFSKIFQQHSGKLYLNKQSLIIDLHHKMLTEITPHITKIAISQLKKQLVKRWVKLQELASNKNFSEQQMYDWISVNEIPVAQLLLQYPQYSQTVFYLIEKYKNRRKEHGIMHAIRDMLLTIGAVQAFFALGSGVLFSTGIFLAIAITALIVGHIQNFGEIALILFDTFKSYGRYRMLERSLLSGTTMRARDAAELLREFKVARRKLVVAGTIGFPVNAGAVYYIVKNIKLFKRIAFLETFIGWFCHQHENGVLSDEELLREN